MKTNPEASMEHVDCGIVAGKECLEFLDLPYLTNAEHERQRIDLYLPEGEGPFPVAIWIHGGGWQSCDRRVGKVAGFITAEGFAMASIGYRIITDGFPFPAQIHDGIAGLNWLARHADEYRLDLEKIGVFGHSAGGHISALLMLASRGMVHFPGVSAPNVRISAGAFWSAVFDLSRKRGKWPEGSTEWGDDSTFCKFFFPGGRYDEEFAQWASPTSHLKGDDWPSMLVVHGDQDDLVPFEQARAFTDTVRNGGGRILFRKKTGKGHEMPPEIWGDSLSHFQSAFER